MPLNGHTFTKLAVARSRADRRRNDIRAIGRTRVKIKISPCLFSTCAWLISRCNYAPPRGKDGWGAREKGSSSPLAEITECGRKAHRARKEKDEKEQGPRWRERENRAADETKSWQVSSWGWRKQFANVNTCWILSALAGPTGPHAAAPQHLAIVYPLNSWLPSSAVSHLPRRGV